MPKFKATIYVNLGDEGPSIAWAGEVEAKDETEAEYIISKEHFNQHPESAPIQVGITAIKEKEKK